ncbi:MAG: hypothetical protein ABI162_06200 [Luteolibacter sp.]
MLVACCIIGCVMLLIAVSSMVNGARAVEVITGCFCSGIFGVIPLVILVVSRRRSRGPRCRTDMVKSQAAIPAGRVAVDISADETLPRICVSCGGATHRVSKLRFHAAHTDANPYDWSRVHPLLMIFLVWKKAIYVLGAKLVMAFERFREQRKSRNSGIVFRIPHCRACVRHRPIAQRHFDFHGRRMTITAPVEFRARLSEMRKSAPHD